MTVAFAHPPHPASEAKVPATLERSNSRDLHVIPDFDLLPSQVKPVLYLPPLLSALPEHLSSEHAPDASEASVVFAGDAQRARYVISSQY